MRGSVLLSSLSLFFILHHHCYSLNLDDTTLFVRFNLTSSQHHDLVEQLEYKYGDTVDIAGIRYTHADIFIENSVYREVRDYLTQKGVHVISAKPYASFPEEMIASSVRYNKNITSRYKRAVTELDTAVYHTYDQIMSWLSTDIIINCGDLCQLIDVGHSVEGRSIQLIKIGKSKCGEKQKIFIDCGIHAREWVSPTVCVYIISKLINDYTTDRTVTNMVDRYDWYINPIANPDGYVFSMMSNKNRLWRKNRRPIRRSSCTGVDLNRNWSYKWGGRGSSSTPCTETYRGTAPFSEPESEGIRQFVRRHSGWHTYLSFHSYGKLVLYGWGYTTKRSSRDDAVKAAADAYNAALSADQGENYIVGKSGGKLAGFASGSSTDWFYSAVSDGGAGCTYSYTVELRDSDQTGFVLPRSQILPTVSENWAGLKGYITYLESVGTLTTTGDSCTESASNPQTSPTSTPSLNNLTGRRTCKGRRRCKKSRRRRLFTRQ